MTEIPTSTASTEEPVSQTPMDTTPVAASGSASPDSVLRDYHEARRHEDQWRSPQLLTALVTPILAFIGLTFNLGGSESNANISIVLAIITGVGAALMAVESWRWHRTAASRLEEFRTQFPGDAALLMKQPA